MKVVHFLYQWLVALPIFAIFTIFTALVTMLFFPFKNAMWIVWIQRLWSRSFFWLTFTKVEVEGVENIDKQQSYVFVANHQSATDVWLVYGYLPVVFKWIMKYELKKVPFIGWGCMAAGHIFINRRNPMLAKQSLDEAEKTLQNGVSVVVFTEGTRSTDGQVGKFKRGAYMLAFDLNLPIIPLTLNGCQDVWRKGSLWINFGKTVKLTIHKPIDNSIYTKDNQAEIIELSRQTIISAIQ